MSTMDRAPAPVKVTFDSARPVRRGFFGSGDVLRPCPVVWGVMEELNYPAVNILAALSWIEHRGCVDGCPVVHPEDWFVVNCAALDPGPSALAWTTTPEPPMAFHPSSEDSVWAAQAFAR